MTHTGITDSPTQQIESFGVRFAEPEDILRMAVRYWINGSEQTGRWLPDEVQTSPFMVGLTIEHQAAIFVESTDLFERAKLFIWIAFRGSRHVEEPPFWLREYMGQLSLRLPMTLYPPRPEMCGEELERQEKAADAARMAEIDAKHIRKSPGMAKIFRGFNADWHQVA